MSIYDNDELAPEWMHNYILTWSGRWHIYDVHRNFGEGLREAVALCGAYGYRRDYVPRGYRKLQDIKAGRRPALHCKKCEKAAGR